MSRETFKKEMEVLRTFFIDDGIYDRETISNMLGISKDTYDDVRLKLSDMFIGEERFERGYGRAQLKYDYHKNNENFLMALYRTKSLKKKEKVHLAFVLKMMGMRKWVTVADIMSFSSDYYLGEKGEEEWGAFQRTQVNRYLSTLSDAGLIVTSKEQRPHRYRLNTDLFDALTRKELLDLYYFVDFFANVEIPSSPGYLLKDTLRSYISATFGSDMVRYHAYEYQYNNFGRVLDEAVALQLMADIEDRKALTLTYHHVKTGKKYVAKQKPGDDSVRIGIVPVRVLYDYHLSRWYLIAKDAEREKLSKFRVDYIVNVEAGESVSEAVFSRLQQQYEEEFHYSWLVGNGQPVKVRIKFYFQPTEASVNFIKARVLQQGQWGKIVEEKEDSFVYEVVVNDELEIKPWIRSFGSSAEVLTPSSLREQMIKDWEEVSAAYESVSENE